MYQSRNEVPVEDLLFTEKDGEQVKPKVTEFLNWMTIRLREGQKPEPIIISFKSSGLKDCKKWNSLIRMSNLPAYAKVYTVESVHKTKGQLDWEGFKIIPGEFVPEEFFTMAEAWFRNLSEAGVKMDTTGLGAEEGQASDSPF